MVRIASEKLQHRTAVVGEALQEGEVPDRVALYLPDGTPIDLDADELPPGGANGDILVKASSVDGDVDWIAPPHDLPVGGSSGQLLSKNSATDRDVGWVARPLGVPSGGASGHILKKASAADGDLAWVSSASILPPNELPPGGTSGYILAKASGVDGDVTWIPAPAGGGGSVYELPVGGSTGQLLAKASAADRDVIWSDPPVDGTKVARRDVVKSTASLGAALDTGDEDTRLAGNGESGTWAIGPGVLLTHISVNRPCRVRLYTTSSQRSADVARDRFTDPVGNHGCLSEFLFISTLNMDSIPADYLASGSGDVNIYYRIDNYDLVAGVVTVTITVKDVER